MYRLRESPLGGETVWRVEAESLVRARRGGETRWPLSSLTRMTLLHQDSRWGPPMRMARLRFGRRSVAFGSRGWIGPGRAQDRTADFSAFVRHLAAAGAASSSAASFRLGGGAPPAQVIVYGLVGLLGVGVAALLAVCLSTGLVGVGLEMAPRLLFLLILLLAALPWLPQPAPRAFDPRAVPETLAPRA